jgi:hypothetical protein
VALYSNQNEQACPNFGYFYGINSHARPTYALNQPNHQTTPVRPPYRPYVLVRDWMNEVDFY